MIVINSVVPLLPEKRSVNDAVKVPALDAAVQVPVQDSDGKTDNNVLPGEEGLGKDPDKDPDKNSDNDTEDSGHGDKTLETPHREETKQDEGDEPSLGDKGRMVNRDQSAVFDDSFLAEFDDTPVKSPGTKNDRAGNGDLPTYTEGEGAEFRKKMAEAGFKVGTPGKSGSPGKNFGVLLESKGRLEDGRYKIEKITKAFRKKGVMHVEILWTDGTKTVEPFVPPYKGFSESAGE